MQEGEDSELEGEQEPEKITRNWSVLKSTPELSKSKVIVTYALVHYSRNQRLFGGLTSSIYSSLRVHDC